jgi:hypothetical protein
MYRCAGAGKAETLCKVCPAVMAHQLVYRNGRREKRNSPEQNRKMAGKDSRKESGKKGVNPRACVRALVEDKFLAADFVFRNRQQTEGIAWGRKH